MAGSRVCRLAMPVAVAVLISGCISRPPGPEAGHDTAVLSCRQSAGQQPADPDARPVDGVQSFALRGDTNAYDTLPAWKSRDGHRYLVWKAFLAIAPSARPYRTVTVTNPATARLFYVSPARWGAASGSRVIGPPPRRIRFPSCDTQYAGYTGGILITRPSCVTLVVSGPTGRLVTVIVPILITRCPRK